MRQSHPDAGLETLCRLFGHSRQAYYSYEKNRRRDHYKEMFVLNLVDETRSEMRCKLGVRKLKVMLDGKLEAHGIKMGRDQLFSLLQQNGRLLRKRRRKPKTTDSHHWLHKYPNLTRELEVSEAHIFWVSDITYIRVRGGFNYLSLITDGYSRKVVGYCLYPTLEATGSAQALEMAFSQWADPGDRNLIHHSDKGIQYCSQRYVRMLEQHKVRISMGSSPYENPIAERINETVKEEFWANKVYENHQEASKDIDEIIRIYNQKRPHASVDYLTPEKAHDATGVLRRRWKSYSSWRMRKPASIESKGHAEDPGIGCQQKIGLPLSGSEASPGDVKEV
jgi:transposase InsO family protein